MPPNMLAPIAMLTLRCAIGLPVFGSRASVTTYRDMSARSKKENQTPAHLDHRWIVGDLEVPAGKEPSVLPHSPVYGRSVDQDQDELVWQEPHDA
jgi:hypothetical protein